MILGEKEPKIEQNGLLTKYRSSAEASMDLEEKVKVTALPK